jgi:hypothetical protein
MENNIIKKLLREALLEVLLESNEDNQGRKDYSDLQTAMGKPLAPTMVGLFTAMYGKKPDATERSLFRKKLYQEKNDEGSVYQFDDEELNKARTSLKIK